MNRTIIFGFIMAAMLSGGFISCRTALNCEGMVSEGRVLIEEKWLDDDTFLVVGKGSAVTDEKDQFVRQSQARETAEISAKDKAFSQLGGGQNFYAYIREDFRLRSLTEEQKKLIGIIKEGALCLERYKPNDECIVVIAIQYGNLKGFSEKVKEQGGLSR